MGHLHDSMREHGGRLWGWLTNSKQNELLFAVSALALGVICHSTMSPLPISLLLLIRPARRLTPEQIALFSSLRETAELIATSGDLSARAPVPPTEEIVPLVAAFNTMLDKLQASRQSLEAEVEKQTRDMQRAKVAAETSEHQLRSITDSAHDAILMMNPEGRITYWNPAAEHIFGFSSSEALGRNLHELLAPERYHADHRAAFPEFQRTGRGNAVGKTVELFARRKDNKEIPVSLSLSAVALSGVWHAVGILRDISELKRNEAELRQAKETAEAATQAKSRFLANMSHEIRTPMNAIIGLGQLVLRTDLRPEQRDYVEKIESAGESLLGIINEILDLSKIEENRLELESVDFELATVLRTMREIIDVKAEAKGLQVRYRATAGVPARLVGDPLRLRQILIILMDNAVKFTPYGEISLVVSVAEDTAGEGIPLLFSVADSGIGITEKDLATLFLPFSQGDSSTTRKYGGTGLGLSIAKRLVELMGGTIRVESLPGSGSTFSFTAHFGRSATGGLLEITEVTTPSMERPVEGTPVKISALCGARVLLVEDNLINQRVAREILEHAGMLVTIANNGREAVEMVAAGPGAFNVILMDIQMPEMDGYEATRAIRAMPGGRQIPIVAMTAHVMLEEQRQSLAAGMNAHVGKPIDPKALAATLGQCIAAEPPVTAVDDEDVASSDCDMLDPMPGFDIGTALRRVAGNCALLRLLYVEFVEQFQETADRLAELMAADRWDDARHLTHALKGTAGNIGATQVYGCAATVEKEIIEGRVPVDLGALRVALAAACSVIDTLPAVADDLAARPDGGVFRDYLDELDTLLENNDYLPGEKIARLRRLAAEDGQQELTQALIRQLVNLAYVDARQTIAAIRRQLPRDPT